MLNDARPDLTVFTATAVSVPVVTVVAFCFQARAAGRVDPMVVCVM
jgi:hypothetical protein